MAQCVKDLQETKSVSQKIRNEPNRELLKKKNIEKEQGYVNVMFLTVSHKKNIVV